MDVNTLRAVLTLVCFAIFIGIVVWAYSAGRRERFNEAARVPLLDDDTSVTTQAQEKRDRQ